MSGNALQYIHLMFHIKEICHNVKLQMNIKINKTCYLDTFIMLSTEMNYKSEQPEEKLSCRNNLIAMF